MHWAVPIKNFPKNEKELSAYVETFCTETGNLNFRSESDELTDLTALFRWLMKGSGHYENSFENFENLKDRSDSA